MGRASDLVNAADKLAGVQQLLSRDRHFDAVSGAGRLAW